MKIVTNIGVSRSSFIQIMYYINQIYFIFFVFMYCNSEKYRVEWRVLGCMRGQVGVVRSVFTYHSLIILLVCICLSIIY